MKNVICIVIDAFCHDNLYRKIGDKEVTPFLNSLAGEGLSFDHVYSTAPYTEASQVALLGGENTLESGGYMFGNGNACSPVLCEYQKAGFHTVLGYSPYVYSKGYLRGVSEYYYTRLYSILPLFDYRLSYFRAKMQEGKFTETYYDACFVLIDEAFETWLLQCDALLEKSGSVEMIWDCVSDFPLIAQIRDELKAEKEKFLSDRKAYIKEILTEWKSHSLVSLNGRYNQKKELPLNALLKQKYYARLKEAQKRYSSVLKKQKPDFAYMAGMVFREKNPKDSARTLKAWRYFKRNDFIGGYLDSLDEKSKTEAGLYRMLKTAAQTARRLDGENAPYFMYFQPQDFHLPSVFHSVDCAGRETVEKEFEAAFSLMDSLPPDYNRNLLADLSAHYCDLKLSEFYAELKASLKNDFLFVVTADHGYPSYYNPPRPIIYNQTYTEAFHVPLIAYAPEISRCAAAGSLQKDGLYSLLDGIELVKQLAGISPARPVAEKDHVLCEYAGPGCPMITEKPLWYTLITKRCKLSADVSLHEKPSFSCVKSFYDLTHDCEQKKNLFKKRKFRKEILSLLELVAVRHEELSLRFEKDTYLEKLIKNLREGL